MVEKIIIKILIWKVHFLKDNTEKNREIFKIFSSKL